jgi:biopolymer transport protein ExbB
MNFIYALGPFLYPLAICSFLSVFIFVERLLALRDCNVFSERDRQAIEKKQILVHSSSSYGRIVQFYNNQRPSAERLKAFAQMEVIKLEKRMFILEVIVTVAPLIGLLGTVAGLVEVFSNFSAQGGSSVPDQTSFVQGIALALSTTMGGLIIAIPTVVGYAYLTRRLDVHVATLSLVTENLLEQGKQP